MILEQSFPDSLVQCHFHHHPGELQFIPMIRDMSELIGAEKSVIFTTAILTFKDVTIIKNEGDFQDINHSFDPQ